MAAMNVVFVLPSVNGLWIVDVDAVVRLKGDL